jgi:decaprenylphospho-beta-D-ribofuranose 2-oxidase
MESSAHFLGHQANPVADFPQAEIVNLPADKITRLSGFGRTAYGDTYVYRPTTVAEVREIVTIARHAGRTVTVRGTGLSYGDANFGCEGITIDFCRMNRILNWDKAVGIIEVEPGVTIQDLWRHTLEDGYWPPVVSGTMHPTMGGALAMNIHGKNNYCVGPIGDHVIEIDVMDGRGDVRTLKPESELFKAVIGGIGLLGIITRVKLQMKKVACGNLRVLPLSAKNFDEQFAIFERLEHDADYMVSWIDCFGRGKQLGRGAFHAAWYLHEGNSATLRPANQDLPDMILNFFPKSMVWKILKRLNNRFWMHKVNWAKQASAAKLGDGKSIEQSLVGFSFLLDYVPNWRNAYLPGGLIQYQSFVPKDRAKEVFTTLIQMQQSCKLESFLGVMKRHRPDKFLLTHAVDGYSLALDFKVTKRNRERLIALCHQMNDVVLAAGGRFYFAKDSTLRPSDVEKYLGSETLATFRRLREQMDPDGVFVSQLGKRVGLV